MKQLTVDQYKETILEILVRIDQICKENNLKYMLFYGTLLGAVRHQGFIPWDDDIDIIMPRKDYDCLRTIIQNKDYGLNFICIETNPDMIYYWGKICDTNTIMYEKNFKHVEGYGAFVDVFPYDYAPDEDRKRNAQQRWLRLVGKLLTHSCRTGYERAASIKTNLLRRIGLIAGNIISTETILKRLNKYIQSFNEEPTNHYRIGWGDTFEKKELDGFSVVTFEGHEMYGPSDVDAILTKLFGDYMTLPPEKERVNRHQLNCYYK